MVQCATPWEDQSCCPEDLAAAFIWQGLWASGVTYPVNAAVAHNGSTWVAVKAHTSSAANEPPADAFNNPVTEFWNVMAVGGTITTWKGDWSGAAAYDIADAVQHNGSSYISLIANTNIEPGTPSAAGVWDLLASGGLGIVWRGAWNAGTTYIDDDAVSYFDGTKTDSWISIDNNNLNQQPDISPLSWEILASGGEDGTDGTDGVSFIWQGVYSAGTTYAKDDTVQFDVGAGQGASSYISLQSSNTGNTPNTSPAFWELMAEGGIDGLGTGDVVGPAGGTIAGGVSVFADTTGKEIAASGLLAVDLVNQSDAEIKTQYENNADTNAFDDAEQAKLAGIEANANDYTHPNHSGDVVSAGDGVQTIQPNVVTETKIANNAVTSGKIAAGAVISTKLGVDSVTAAAIAANAVGNSELGTDAVQTVNILDANVTNAKLANQNLNTIKGASVTGPPVNLTADQTLTILGTSANPPARTGTNNTFTKGQISQVLEVATWTSPWDIADSPDFNITASVSGAAGNLPIPTSTVLANGQAQAGQITLTSVVANTAGFAVGWTFPDGASPDISAGGDYTLYYRIWRDAGGVTHNRLTGLPPWS